MHMYIIMKTNHVKKMNSISETNKAIPSQYSLFFSLRICFLTQRWISKALTFWNFKWLALYLIDTTELLRSNEKNERSFRWPHEIKKNHFFPVEDSTYWEWLSYGRSVWFHQLKSTEIQICHFWLRSFQRKQVSAMNMLSRFFTYYRYQYMCL